MIFSRLIWAGLAVAMVVGALQTGLQRWQAIPIILAAEAYEDQKRLPVARGRRALARRRAVRR